MFEKSDPISSDKELSVLEDYDILADKGIVYISSGGFASEMTPEGLVPIISAVDEGKGRFAKGRDELKKALEVGANAYAKQYACSDMGDGGDGDFDDPTELINTYQHTTLGRLDDNGDFEPIVTVLNSEYIRERDNVG
jgi:hypothetical protein